MNNEEIASLQTKSESLGRKLTDRLDKMILTDDFGSWNDFQSDYNVASCTSIDIPYDTKDSAVAKKTRAHHTLINLITRIQNSERYMNARATMFETYSLFAAIGGSGLGIYGSQMDSSATAIVGGIVGVAGAAFGIAVLYRRNAARKKYDSALDKCYDLVNDIHAGLNKHL